MAVLSKRERKDALQVPGGAGRTLAFLASLALCDSRSVFLIAVWHHQIHREHTKRVILGGWRARLRAGPSSIWAPIPQVLSRCLLLLLPAEAQVGVGLHFLTDGREGIWGPGSRLPLQPLAPGDQLQDTDPDEVNEDLPKLDEAQDGASHPEAKLPTQAGEEPDNLPWEERLG